VLGPTQLNKPKALRWDKKKITSAAKLLRLNNHGLVPEQQDYGTALLKHPLSLLPT
jgi:hypothetical protein